jgi:hypothetical protein
VVLHLRRMKAGLLRATVGDGVRRIVSRIEDVDHDYDERRNADRYAQDWARGIVSVRRGFAGMLKKAGLTMDDVMAEAFAKEIDSFERFDRMLARLRPAVTTPYARLIVTAQHSAPQCGKWSMKSRMRSFETSKPAN